jgi:aspartyl-tRNA(Asn)/glutamyl-tRNA(Gln) amidotransferase subunit A
MKDLTELSITELDSEYASGRASPVDVVEAYLDLIDRRDGIVRAFLHLFRDRALERAAALAAEGSNGRPLYGVPVAVKDNICTRGLPTSCASRILEDYRPPYDATVVERLEEAGAVIIGKTNLDEFAMGSSTENSAFGATRNPWNPDCAPGGSSGGSAAAVAAGLVPVALGSDTGGSIRQPAAFCGVAGLKGTYGRVSRYGLVAFASSLDQIGPFTRNIEDCARVMEVIAGHDVHDATSIPGPPPPLIAGLEAGVQGLKVAIPGGTEKWDIGEGIRRSFAETVDILKRAGADITEVDLPDVDASIACYYILANAEASSNLARYDGVKYGSRKEAENLVDMYERTRGEGFGEEVKRRILLGTYVLSAGYYDAYYTKAQQVKALICDGFEAIFKGSDLIVLPTTPTAAFRIGEKIDDPIAMYLSDIFTTQANIAGLPAISIPSGLSDDALPIGMQLMAAAGNEQVLLSAARFLERRYSFAEKHRPDFRRLEGGERDGK